MLFSASLITEVLPGLWERDQDEGRQHLDDLRLLTRGALAEMRTLLTELRPAALTDAALGELLRPLAEAMTGRTRVPVALTVDGQRYLPPDVQIALYRVAQEGLHNVARHAVASTVAMSLRSGPQGVELCIKDDGRGFDPALVPPDHFGLRIMRERIDTIGATLAIDSAPGRGTQVVVHWADPATSEGP
jgi:two-component system nitrate/nitrite sensor histidine kinase NarX